MRTSGEIERDTRVISLLRRIADALDKIAGTLAEVHDGLKPPKVIIPEERGDLCHET